MTGQLKILESVEKYYSRTLAAFGETPQGVDWNGEESQLIRFEQLTKIINSRTGFSINDLGCGYGAFLDFLTRHYLNFSYNGYDISEDMILAARRRHSRTSNAMFSVSYKPLTAVDYSISSGIFNVRLDCPDAEWLEYIKNILDMIDRTTRRGFAFNCLTSYSDSNKMREYLYYADPLELFDFCKRRYSRDVSLLHDYDLYEFTILVRKRL